MNTKIFAFYLPQFHETPYNDEWWGKGFTDWISSKNAKPLFKDHKQPRIPYSNNYYDLGDENGQILQWQASLAKEHGVDGFCIYHYWFPSGQFLDKPCKVLLSHPEIDIEYSFCWDAGSWKRTWTFSGDSENQILVQQDFGNEELWKKHYNDLRPYFLDKRYSKVENKPVFLIYRSQIIGCLSDMKACWNQLAQKDGFAGIYLIVGDLEERELIVERKVADAFYNYEPQYSINKYQKSLYHFGHLMVGAIKKRMNRWFRRSFFPDKRDAAHAYRLIKRTIPSHNSKTYLGIFSDYDDTPRRNMKGVVYTRNNPKLFEDCLIRQIKKSLELGNEFLFITAWNEWGESAYLEPDEVSQYTYLDIVKNVRSKFE